MLVLCCFMVDTLLGQTSCSPPCSHSDTVAGRGLPRFGCSHSCLSLLVFLLFAHLQYRYQVDAHQPLLPHSYHCFQLHYVHTLWYWCFVLCCSEVHAYRCPHLSNNGCTFNSSEFFLANYYVMEVNVTNIPKNITASKNFIVNATQAGKIISSKLIL